MSYSTSNPPVLVSAGPLTRGTNKVQRWIYVSTDGAATVDADGYITNGQDLGMAVGDIVEVVDSDASPVIVTIHRVTSLSTTNQSVDLSDGDTLITGTDSD